MIAGFFAKIVFWNGVAIENGELIVIFLSKTQMLIKGELECFRTVLVDIMNSGVQFLGVLMKVAPEYFCGLISLEILLIRN